MRNIYGHLGHTNLTNFTLVDCIWRLGQGSLHFAFVLTRQRRADDVRYRASDADSTDFCWSSTAPRASVRKAADMNSAARRVAWSFIIILYVHAFERAVEFVSAT